jgi:hypothetical protein
MIPVNKTPAHQEQEVLAMLNNGVSGRQTALNLGVPETTVRAIKARHAQSEYTRLSNVGATRLVVGDSGAEFEASVAQFEDVPPKRPMPFYTRTHTAVPASSEVTRILAIGDLHDDPYLSKERFGWIGKHAREMAPDHIVAIGDICDLESLSFHAGNDTDTGKFKPRFMTDMASLREALDTLFEASGDLSCPFDLTEGNHEHRIRRFEDSSPEVVGMLQRDFTGLLKQYGIRNYEYGQFIKVAGVNFTHCPMSVMGKPFGGATATQTVARQASGDIVFGHTHKANVVTSPRLGGEAKVTIIDLGCALPQGYLANYSKHCLTGWSYGIFELIVQNGSIQGYNMIPMDELERRYA